MEELKTLAAERGMAIYELALAWVLSNPVVSVALVGARTPAEVEANTRAPELTLSNDDKQVIEAVFARHGVDTRPDIWID